MGILSYFARHRTVANLLLVVMVAAGAVALPNMRAQFFPDVVVDNVSITIPWDGAGAEDVDRAIVQLVEPALLSIPGVTDTRARSTEGSASITIDFVPGTDIDRAEDEVQSAIDALTDLPEGADDPRVRRGTWSDRVTDAVITGPVGVDQLARFADAFALRLRDAGVTDVTIRGVAAPATQVEVASADLVRYDLTLGEMAQAIRAASRADPAGDVAGAERIRSGTEARDADAIAAITLRQDADGTALTVGDVARVRTLGPDRVRAYFVGDDPAILVNVSRDAQGDAIALQERVEAVAAELQASLPAGTTIELIRTRADYISGRLDILITNAATGLAFVVALLFLFLNARTAFWVAAGIPVAMAAAIALMYAAGLTINMISLFALIITLGIVVDDAIVVGEHADWRARSLGEEPVVAAERAAQRMFLPVFSATLTTVIAFSALVVVGGRFGDLIADIPYTVIVVLIASLVECFLILPRHMAHAVAANARDHWYDIPSRLVNRGLDVFKAWVFRPLMGLVVRARYAVVAGAVLLLAGQAALLIRGDVQWRFFNAPEQGSVTGNFAMLPGADRDDSIEMMRELQRAVAAVGAAYEAEHGLSPVAYAIAEIGGNTGRALAGSDTKEPDQLGSISIELIDADLRPYSSFAFVAALQDEVRQHPLAETVSFRSWGSGPGGDDIDVQIAGADPQTLKAAAEALKADLSRIPDVAAVEDSLAYDKDELILTLTPQGEALGFDIEGIGAVLRGRLSGIEAASFPDGPRQATVDVVLPASELRADFLDRAVLRSPSGEWVPLPDIVAVDRRSGFSTLTRENGVLLISVTADLTGDDAARATEISQTIAGTLLPDLEERFAVSTSLAGLAEQERAFLSDARTGTILCLLGIYLVLAWIFASWSRPMVIMAVIPFGLVGAIWGHKVWDVPMSLFSVVGLIGMIGIVINDSIVLVTTIDEKARQRGLVPAIVDGTTDRLRPVLLTTLTTVLGLAPLLYEGSSQAQFLRPTVITLAYGLGFGMVLVLLLVPALMAIGGDVGDLTRAARRGLSAPRLAVRLPAFLGALAAVGAFAATLGPVLATGAAWAPLAAVAPVPITPLLAFGAFAGLTAAGLLLVWLASALALPLTRRIRRGRSPDAPRPSRTPAT
ncbi:MAG: efflux RND transporter permease subunit [Paracoccaceae bacterium]